jgi:hypothetical protein
MKEMKEVKWFPLKKIDTSDCKDVRGVIFENEESRIEFCKKIENAKHDSDNCSCNCHRIYREGPLWIALRLECLPCTEGARELQQYIYNFDRIKKIISTELKKGDKYEY